MFRPIWGGDIAILCRSNDRCAAVAKALAAAGLTVAVGRQGLIATPEAGLALAVLRFLADPTGTLAMVELAHGAAAVPTGKQPEWLESRLLPEAARRAREGSPVLRALDAVRGRLLHLTPVEALEVAIVAGDLVGQVRCWGNRPTVWPISTRCAGWPAPMRTSAVPGAGPRRRVG